MKYALLTALLSLSLAFLSSYAASTAPSVAVVSEPCGASEMALQCRSLGKGKADCLHPVLTIKTDGGQAQKLGNPKGIEEQSPMGLACVTSQVDHNQYFYVLFGSLPSGCDVCEWHHLYDTHGKLLTTSDPATIVIPDAPPTQSIAPNNRSFDDLSKKLNLGNDQASTIVCVGPHIDGKGNPRCTAEVSHGR